MVPSHVESVASFQEPGKAATTQESCETSCRTCICGCKRRQTKEKPRLSALRAPTSSTDEEFRSIEALLDQVLRRTTANEPLSTVLQTKGQKGFEAWHAIVRRCDQKNMSDKHSAYAALISKISERDDGAKDVEQFDVILSTLNNETNNFENRFGAIRDEEKMLAVKKLMPESLLNFRFRGTTVSYSELLVALEIIIDKVATVPTARNRKIDTSAAMDSGMVAKDDGKCEGRRRQRRTLRSEEGN